MDCRTTLSASESFFDLLHECMQSQRQASMLIDLQGIVRKQGLIKALDKDKMTLTLDNGDVVDLKNIIAVNGIFASNYSEC